MGTIRTKRGVKIDIDSVRAKHDKEIAAGNMNVNARGDKLGPGGKIVEKREDRTKAYYKDNPKAVKKVSIKSESTEEIRKEIEDTDEAETNEKTKKKAPDEILTDRTNKTTGKNKKKKEVELDNGDIVMVDEDQDPDFNPNKEE